MSPPRGGSGERLQKRTILTLPFRSLRRQKQIYKVVNRPAKDARCCRRAEDAPQQWLGNARVSTTPATTGIRDTGKVVAVRVQKRKSAVCQEQRGYKDGWFKSSSE